MIPIAGLPFAQPQSNMYDPWSIVCGPIVFSVSSLQLNLHFVFFTLQFSPALSYRPNKSPFPR